jgi:hypothetical protein
LGPSSRPAGQGRGGRPSFFPLGTEYPTSVEQFLTCINTPDSGSCLNFF